MLEIAFAKPALPKSGAGKIMWRELQDRETTAPNSSSAASFE